MAKTMTKAFALVTVLLACSSCGGADGTTNPLGSADLTASELTALTNQIVGGANTVATSAQSGGSSSLANTGLSPKFGTATTSPNGAIACPVSGHVTYTGNITTSWDTTSWSVYGLVTFNYGDRTNNLNDCQVTSDAVLDGTLTFTISGNNNEPIGWSLTGTIEVDKPVNGGLSPRGSCFVAITLPHGGTKATGTICGQSIN